MQSALPIYPPPAFAGRPYARAEPTLLIRRRTSCRSHRSNFLKVVMTRQAASFGGYAIDRHRLLELLDSEIDAFNDLIATRCGVQ